MNRATSGGCSGAGRLPMGRDISKVWLGSEAEMAAVITSQYVMESFQALTIDEINCMENIELNWRGKTVPLSVLNIILKGGQIACFPITARYAPLAFKAIGSSLYDDRRTKTVSESAL